MLAIPARGEVDLSAESVWAVFVGNALVFIRSPLVIQADEADSVSGSSFSIGFIALKRVASDHAEIFREGFEFVVLWSATLLVVDSHTSSSAAAFASLGNVFERAIFSHEV